MKDGFAHRLRLDQIRDGERIDLTADEAERRAVADRFGLQSIERLEAHATLYRKADSVRAEGRVTASLDQSCVITGDRVPLACRPGQPRPGTLPPRPQVPPTVVVFGAT